MQDCKILRLARSGFCNDIVTYTDKLIDEQYSNRKIATMLTKKYSIPISREAILAYRQFRIDSIKGVNSENRSYDNQKPYIIRPIKK